MGEWTSAMLVHLSGKSQREGLEEGGGGGERKQWVWKSCYRWEELEMGGGGVFRDTGGERALVHAVVRR
jgi:hypothetical protein